MHEAASGRSPIGPRLLAPVDARHGDLLCPEALAFLTYLARTFHGRVAQSLAYRGKLRARLAAGEKLDFLPETASIRSAAWTVADPPEELRRATVEIPGPPDRSAIRAARDAGADVFIADFEDRLVPAWERVLEAHATLRDACSEETPILMLRPRALGKEEPRLLADGRPLPAFLFDLGVHLFHSARARVRRGSRAHVVIPGIENHLEARLWNDVFVNAEGRLGLPRGSIRAVVRIETFPAAFEMDEILYKLWEYATGLGLSRWSYVRSVLELAPPDLAPLPGASGFTLRQPFLRAAAELLAGTCRRRGARAVGGLSRDLPIRWDARASLDAAEAFRSEKRIESEIGFAATWVAHPAFVPVARALLEGRGEVRTSRVVTASDLQAAPAGTPSEADLRDSVRTVLAVSAARAGGRGCVAVRGTSQDPGSAAAHRVLIAASTKRRVALDDGRVLTPDLVRTLAAEEARFLSGAPETIPRSPDGDPRPSPLVAAP